MRVRTPSLLALAVLLSACISTPQLAAAAPKPNFNIVPITISNTTLQNGQLLANGLVGDQPFTAPINLALAEVQPLQVTCPILNLELGPINLDLLGLIVDTSAICLEITAEQGGGLLGSLLCGIANLLQGGVPLETILSDLPPPQLDRLTAGVTHLLNEVLTQATSARAVAGVSGTGGEPGIAQIDTSCDILNLALGPIDLNLLGLRVQLDDCEGGPVTVDVTAEPEGGLLGSLLCSLAGLLDSPGETPGALNPLLQAISTAISQPLNQAP